jgi:hypothetical protein
MTKTDGILKELESEFPLLDKDVVFLIKSTPLLEKGIIKAYNSSLIAYKPSSYGLAFKKLKNKNPSIYKKINYQVDKIFNFLKHDTTIRKLDPKNPADRPDIRRWLRIRDCVLNAYFAENQKERRDYIGDLKSAVKDLQNYLTIENTNYRNAMEKVKNGFLINFPHEVTLMGIIRNNWFAYLNKLIIIIEGPFPFLEGTKMTHELIDLFLTIKKDYDDEKKVMNERIQQLTINDYMDSKIIRLDDLNNKIIKNLKYILDDKDNKYQKEFDSLSNNEKVEYIAHLRPESIPKSFNEYVFEIYCSFIEPTNARLSIKFTIALKNAFTYDELNIREPQNLNNISYLVMNEVKISGGKFGPHISHGLDLLNYSNGIPSNRVNILDWPVNKYLEFTVKIPKKDESKTYHLRLDADFTQPYSGEKSGLIEIEGDTALQLLFKVDKNGDYTLRDNRKYFFNIANIKKIS